MAHVAGRADARRRMVQRGSHGPRVLRSVSGGARKGPAMRVIYVTAALPRGTDEAFIVPEIRELTRLGHDVLVVPRSPKGNVIHGREVVDRARQEGLVSWRVIRSLRPGKIAAAVPLLRGARSRAVGMKNLAVVPKAIWLADLAGTWRADHIH